MMRSIRFDRGGLGRGSPSTHRLRPGNSRNRRAEFIDFLLVGFCCVRGIVAPISSTLPTNQAVCLRIVDGMVKEGSSHIVFCFWTLWSQLTLSVIASGPGSFVLFPSWELHAGVQGRAGDCHVHVQLYKHGARLVSREACFEMGANCLLLPVCSATCSGCKRHSPAVAAPGPGPIGGPGTAGGGSAICLSAIQSRQDESKKEKNIKQIK